MKFTVDSRPISYSVAAVKLAWGAVVKTADGVATGKPAAAGNISLWSILKGLGPAIMALSLAGVWPSAGARARRSEEHTSELQSRQYLVCPLLASKKNDTY